LRQLYWSVCLAALLPGSNPNAILRAASQKSTKQNRLTEMKKVGGLLYAASPFAAAPHSRSENKELLSEFSSQPQ
jgi:hypothetical protein